MLLRNSCLLVVQVIFFSAPLVPRLWAVVLLFIQALSIKIKNKLCVKTVYASLTGLRLGDIVLLFRGRQITIIVAALLLLVLRFL
jgi:hypothetical protein